MLKPKFIRIYMFEGLQLLIFLLSYFNKSEFVFLNQSSKMMHKEDY